jgi:hypothetical protein
MFDPPDPERISTYEWEVAIVPREEAYPCPADGNPPGEFLAFYAQAWRWSVMHWPQSRFEHLNGAPPRLTVDRRLTVHAGKAGLMGIGIRVSPKGLLKHTVLHEIAHVVGPYSGGHDAIFRRIALDLYVAHLAVDEPMAVNAAEKAGLSIAGTDWQSMPDLWPYNSRPGVPRPRI